MASSGRMLLFQRGLLGAKPASRATALMQPQRRSIYADPQGKSYEREGLVMYVVVRMATLCVGLAGGGGV
jgi:hypothetical protein